MLLLLLLLLLVVVVVIVLVVVAKHEIKHSGSYTPQNPRDGWTCLLNEILTQ